MPWLEQPKITIHRAKPKEEPPSERFGTSDPDGGAASDVIIAVLGFFYSIGHGVKSIGAGIKKILGSKQK